MRPKNRSELTRDVLHQLIDINEDGTIMTWKPRGAEWFDTPSGDNRSIKNEVSRWNNRYAGKEAINTKLKDGSIRGKVCGIAVMRSFVVGIMLDGYYDASRTLTLTQQKRAYKERAGGVIGVSMVDGCADRPYLARFSKRSEHCRSMTDAQRAYDRMAFERLGKDAILNFPDDYGMPPHEFLDPPEGYFEE